MAIGLNAGAGILLILLVMALTPLVKRQVGGATGSDARPDEQVAPNLSPEPGPDSQERGVGWK